MPLRAPRSIKRVVEGPYGTPGGPLIFSEFFRIFTFSTPRGEGGSSDPILGNFRWQMWRTKGKGGKKWIVSDLGDNYREAPRLKVTSVGLIFHLWYSYESKLTYLLKYYWETSYALYLYYRTESRVGGRKTWERGSSNLVAVSNPSVVFKQITYFKLNHTSS